ncbi:glycosyltransferase family 2 protein [Pseudalkalibacillus decolorationis]|uniref:glycosyltransferase family 2 protein n=1 Tax=Pseudalkalibacillus decolorationis TaxID=163879 RepID=UPI0021474E8B|nr:glycosyltransferase [Pseudalkalibacillus decolorationis]
MEKVSIVIPFYNCPYIEHAIESALNQTYKNIEIVVVNDGSTEHTEKLQPYMNQIKYIEKPNGGTSTALNRGIQNATGDYFCWLSSDDIYFPNKVQFQLNEMKRYESAVSYTNYYSINENGEVISFPLGVYTPDRMEFLKTMRTANIINGCTIMINRKVFDEFGIFDESLPYTHDYDMWIRILQKYDFMYINEPLVLYRVHEKMGTRKHWDVIKDEIDFVQKRHSVLLNQLIMKEIVKNMKNK